MQALDTTKIFQKIIQNFWSVKNLCNELNLIYLSKKYLNKFDKYKYCQILFH